MGGDSFLRAQQKSEMGWIKSPPERDSAKWCISISVCCNWWFRRNLDQKRPRNCIKVNQRQLEKLYLKVVNFEFTGIIPGINMEINEYKPSNNMRPWSNDIGLFSGSFVPYLCPAITHHLSTKQTTLSVSVNKLLAISHLRQSSAIKWKGHSLWQLRSSSTINFGSHFISLFYLLPGQNGISVNANRPLHSRQSSIFLATTS